MNISFGQSFIDEAVYKNLLDEPVALFLSNSDRDVLPDTNENSTDSLSDLSSLSYAQKIKTSEVHRVLQVPKGSNARFTIDGKPLTSYYDSSVRSKSSSEGGQFWYTIHSGGTQYLIFIMGFPGIKYRLDKLGSVIPQVIPGSEGLEGGKIYVSGSGIHQIAYTVVSALPDNTFLSPKKFVPIEPTKDTQEKLDFYNATSISSEATNICGPGQEQRCGTCCLYTKSGYYDSIGGVTYDAGDLYKCIDAKCYKCIEIAKKMKMKYVFKRHIETGSSVTGGTGSKCYGCSDVESYPNDCGPCPCTIDWNDASYYDSIIEDRNISSIRYENINAILEKDSDDLSGAIASAWIDLSNLSAEERKMSSYYADRPELQNIPTISDGDNSGDTAYNQKFATETDSSGNVYIVGFEQPENHGKNATYVELDVDKFNDMFPNYSGWKDRIKFTRIPVRGITKNLTKILPLKTLVRVSVDKATVQNVTNVSSFNAFGIGRFYVEGNKARNVFSGVADQQEDTLKLTTELNLQKESGAAFDASEITTGTDPTAGIGSGFGGGKGGSSSTTQISFKDRLLSASNVDSTTVKVDVTTSRPKLYDDTTTLKDIDGNNYNIVSVTKPTTTNDETIDLTKTDIIQRTSGSFDLNQMTGNQLSFVLEIILGSNE